MAPFSIALLLCSIKMLAISCLSPRPRRSALTEKPSLASVLIQEPGPSPAMSQLACPPATSRKGRSRTFLVPQLFRSSAISIRPG